MDSGETEFESNRRKDQGYSGHLCIEDQRNFEDAEYNYLDKYGKFLPIPIKFGTKEESVPDGKDKEDKPKYKTVKNDNIINDTAPIWTKSPNELKDADYLKFYKELYPMSEEPLFWIHLNVDYPFNLTGILYFPKLKKDFEIQRNKIQLYSRQVFITDEVKNVVPEFLQLLHGIIDSDIPLNVSKLLASRWQCQKNKWLYNQKVADK